MNKTVTINLGGIIFHIEENAYESLSRYLNTIKSYFKDSDGRDEIMADIENRIAEMLSIKVSKNKQAVLMSDVDEVIANMGKPEDFAGESANEQKNDQTTVPTSTGKKRIFRDTEHKILGGVCSGIGAYFGFDPLWLRLAWVLLFFLAGTGFLLYIILWIIIPEAKTTAEKLEMHGEPVTAENIGKKVEEELEGLKKTVNEFSDKAKNINAKPHVNKAKNIISQMVDAFIQLLKMLLKTIGKIFGIALLFAGTVLAVVFAAMFFGEKAILSFTSEGVNSFSYSGISEMIFGSSGLPVFAAIGIILLTAIPIIGIFYAGLKLLFGIKNNLKGIGIALTSLWFIGIIICGVTALLLASDFAEKGFFEKKTELIQPKNNILYLETGNTIFYEKKSKHKHSRNFQLKINEDSAFIGNVNLDIVKSENDSFQMEIDFISRGKTTKDAIDLAKNMNYEFSQEDSVLKLNTYYNIINRKWRNQKVKIHLKVPQGKSVFLNEGMEQILYDVNNTTNTLDYEMVGKTWLMGTDGLSCKDCN